jgi:hypothetical protein
MENKVDKYGNKVFKTVTYRGVTIDFYDDDNGQSTYFYYKDELYNCGTYNFGYEDEMHYIVDCDLDYVAEVRLKNYYTIIYCKKDAVHTFWFRRKGGADEPIAETNDLEKAVMLAKDDLERFYKFIEERYKK